MVAHPEPSCEKTSTAFTAVISAEVTIYVPVAEWSPALSLSLPSTVVPVSSARTFSAAPVSAFVPSASAVTGVPAFGLAPPPESRSGSNVSATSETSAVLPSVAVVGISCVTTTPVSYTHLTLPTIYSV